MKKSYVFALAAGLLLMGGCASDAPQVDPTPDNSPEGQGYVRIALNTDQTKGSDLDDSAMEAGDDSKGENTIKKATFLFFYKGVYAFKKVVSVEVSEDGKPIFVNDENHKDKTCAVCKLDKEADAVTVIINHDPTITAGALSNDAVNYRVVDENSDLNNTFVMSNSVYINGTNPTTATRAWRATINPLKVYKTYEEAKAGTDVAATINVERLAAKVRIYSDVYTDAAFDPMNQGGTTLDKFNDNITITFKPTAVGVTATKGGTYLLKNITPSKYSNSGDNFFDKIKDASNQRCFWCEGVEGNSTYLKFNKTGTLFGTSTDKSTNIRYLNENSESDLAKRANVVVMGTYEVKKDGEVIGTVVNGEDNRTFWLTAYGGKFTVHATAESVCATMGITNETLLEKDIDENGHWTGWMKAAGTSIKCIKYYAGRGYYCAPIKRFTIGDNDYYAIVRNHIYDLSIDQISGMGIGLPAGDSDVIPVDPINPDQQTFYVHMRVNVLKWALVDEQHVKW